MKFIPIGNQANLTSDRFNQSNRFNSLSPSMRLDSMGFPHTSWLTKKNGHNEINYKYWDGYDWRFIGSSSIVSMAKGSIYYSPNGLALSGQDSPILAFAKKEIDANNKICVAKTSYGEWSFDELEVDYDIKWIGVFFYGEKINWTLSSSSTLINSDSSLSSNTENASSTSIDNKDTYIVTYDGEVIRIYSFDSSFILINETREEINNLSEFKAIILGNKIGFSYLGDNIIKYNFFDLNSYTWSFLTFNDVSSSITSGTITGMNINGYMSKDESVYPTIYISWIEESISPYISCRIKGCSITEDEEIPYWNMIDSASEDYLVLEELMNFSNVSNQITTSYKITGVCSYLYDSLGETIACPIIFVSGAKTSIFLYKLNSYGVYRWKEYKIDLGYTGVSIPRNIVCFFDSISGKIKVIFDNNEESVVYFENETEIDIQNPLDLEYDESFDIETPNIIILSQVGMYIAKWSDGTIKNQSYVEGIDYTTNGVVLRDSVNPVAIIDNEIVLSEDLSYLSSSSSSQSISSNSSRSSDSSQSPSSMSTVTSDTSILKNSTSSRSISSTSSQSPSSDSTEHKLCLAANTPVYNYGTGEVIAGAKAGVWDIHNGDYGIVTNCQMQVRHRWIPNTIGPPSYSLLRCFYLFTFLLNSNGKIAAAIRGGYGYGGYPNIAEYEPRTDIYNIWTNSYYYDICPFITPLDDMAYSSNFWYTLEQAFSLKTGILNNIHSSSYVEVSYNYKDILKLTGIDNEADLRIQGYMPRANNNDYNNPDFYYLPSFTTHISL